MARWSWIAFAIALPATAFAQTPEEKRSQVFPMSPEDVATGALARLGDGPTHYAGPLNLALATALRAVPRASAVRFMAKNTRKLYE